MSQVGILKLKAKTAGGDIPWMAAGASVLAIALLLALYFQRDSATELGLKARRVDLAEQMQVEIASASEAEKSAVLATTDDGAGKFADQARAALARVEEERRELAELLAKRDPGERDLLAQFTTELTELRHVDSDLLSLAVQNTNVKAYNLAFGPAAVALAEANAALARLITAEADKPDSKTVLSLATTAEISALRIQTLLPPHIAEESDEKMDAMEATMRTEDARVRQSLRDLAALPKVGAEPDLAVATARYAEYDGLRTRILQLSRENTNVRSLAISLNQKRKVMQICQADLIALQQALLAEPIAGTTYGTTVRPR
jgi:hypothetical protein